VIAQMSNTAARGRSLGVSFAFIECINPDVFIWYQHTIYQNKNLELLYISEEKRHFYFKLSGNFMKSSNRWICASFFETSKVCSVHISDKCKMVLRYVLFLAYCSNSFANFNIYKVSFHGFHDEG